MNNFELTQIIPRKITEFFKATSLHTMADFMANFNELERELVKYFRLEDRDDLYVKILPCPDTFEYDVYVWNFEGEQLYHQVVPAAVKVVRPEADIAVKVSQIGNRTHTAKELADRVGLAHNTVLNQLPVLFPHHQKFGSGSTWLFDDDQFEKLVRIFELRGSCITETSRLRKSLVAKTVFKSPFGRISGTCVTTETQLAHKLADEFHVSLNAVCLYKRAHQLNSYEEVRAAALHWRTIRSTHTLLRETAQRLKVSYLACYKLCRNHGMGIVVSTVLDPSVRRGGRNHTTVVLTPAEATCVENYYKMRDKCKLDPFASNQLLVDLMQKYKVGPFNPKPHNQEENRNVKHRKL